MENPVLEYSQAKPRPTAQWFILLVAGIWVVAYIALCGRALVSRPGKNSVFPVFMSAAANWASRQPLYVKGAAEEFRYSPLVAALFVPLGYLPARFGEFVWKSLNFLLFVYGLWYAAKAGLPRAMSALATAVLFILVMPLALGSLNNAQSNPLVLGLMLIASAAAVEKRWTLSAAMITLATCFKLYPIALGMLLVLYFPTRLGWRLLVCLVAATVLPFILQHADYVIEQYSQWARYLASEDRQRGPIGDWYRDLRAVWRIYIMPISPRSYLIVEIGTAAVIGLVCLWMRLCRVALNIRVALATSLGCCWMTATGPATESTTYILIAPAVAWGLIDSRQRGRFWRIGYAVVFGIFLTAQLAINIPHGKMFRDRLQPLPVAGMLLLGMVLADAMARSWRNVSPTDTCDLTIV